MEVLENEGIGTLKGVGPGSELEAYIKRIRANEPLQKVDLCKQLLGPEGARAIMDALKNNTTVQAVLMGADGSALLLLGLFINSHC